MSQADALSFAFQLLERAMINHPNSSNSDLGGYDTSKTGESKKCDCICHEGPRDETKCKCELPKLPERSASEATERPWSVKAIEGMEEAGEISVTGSNGRPIAFCGTREFFDGGNGREADIANARLIVLAVNSHASLKAENEVLKFTGETLISENKELRAANEALRGALENIVGLVDKSTKAHPYIQLCSPLARTTFDEARELLRGDK